MTPLTRARHALVALFLSVGLVACGSSDTSSEPEETSAATADDGTFPATVEHRWGTTTVEKRPERIVVVGLTEQDIVLELGYKPVGTTEWYGEQPDAVWPWAQDLLGDAKPTVLDQTDGLQLERIADLRPDLIIGTNAGLSEADYKKLTKIAPTVAGVKGGTDYFSPWDQQTVLVASALGKKSEGEALVADVKETYAQLAEQHPEFKGKTATFSQGGFYEDDLYVYPDGLNTEFLTYLGFVMNKNITAEPGVQMQVSREQVDLLESDVIVFATENGDDLAKLKNEPTISKLAAVTDGRAVYTDGTLAGAIYFMTPLSLKYVAERIAPVLAQAVAGESPQEIIAE